MGVEEDVERYLLELRRRRREDGSEISAPARVERLFEELGLSWEREGEGWTLPTEHGPVRAELGQHHEVLTFQRHVHRFRRNRRQARYLESLLRANTVSGGAVFAIVEEDEDEGPADLVLQRHVTVVNMDTEEFALALEALFRLAEFLE